MMGIMMPETCLDRSLIINIGLVASCWFISLHPTFHDARSQEPKTVKCNVTFWATLYVRHSAYAAGIYGDFSSLNFYFRVKKLILLYV